MEGAASASRCRFLPAPQSACPWQRNKSILSISISPSESRADKHRNTKSCNSRAKPALCSDYLRARSPGRAAGPAAAPSPPSAPAAAPSPPPSGCSPARRRRLCCEPTRPNHPSDPTGWRSPRKKRLRWTAATGTGRGTGTRGGGGGGDNAPAPPLLEPGQPNQSTRQRTGGSTRALGVWEESGGRRESRATRTNWSTASSSYEGAMGGSRERGCLLCIPLPASSLTCFAHAGRTRVAGGRRGSVDEERVGWRLCPFPSFLLNISLYI